MVKGVLGYTLVTNTLTQDYDVEPMLQQKLEGSQFLLGILCAIRCVLMIWSVASELEPLHFSREQLVLFLTFLSLKFLVMPCGI